MSLHCTLHTRHCGWLQLLWVCFVLPKSWAKLEIQSWRHRVPRHGLMRVCWWVDDFMDTWIIEWCTNFIPMSNIANKYNVTANPAGTITIGNYSCQDYYSCYSADKSIGTYSWYESTCFSFLLIWKRKMIIIYLWTSLAAMGTQHVTSQAVMLVTTAVMSFIRALSLPASSTYSAWMYFDFQKNVQCSPDYFCTIYFSKCWER